MHDDAVPVRRSARAILRRILARSVAAALVAVALWCAPDARAQDAASTRRVAEDTLRHGFQTDLPGNESKAPDAGRSSNGSSSTTPWPREPKRDSPPAARSSTVDTSIPPAVGWTLAILGAAVVLVWIATAVHSARGGRGAALTAVATTTPPPPAAATVVAARPAPAPRPADDGTATAARAEAIAGEGRFDDAAHEMLIAALAVLVTRGRLAADAALTSREALDAARLDDAPRADLRALVAVVERSRFGGRPVDADAFAACSQAFGRLSAIPRSAR